MLMGVLQARVASSMERREGATLVLRAEAKSLDRCRFAHTAECCKGRKAGSDGPSGKCSARRQGTLHTLCMPMTIAIAEEKGSERRSQSASTTAAVPVGSCPVAAASSTWHRTLHIGGWVSPGLPPVCAHLETPAKRAHPLGTSPSTEHGSDGERGG